MVELKSSAGKEIRQILEWQENAVQATKRTGLAVSGYLRDLLMSELGLPIKEAERIADIFDQKILDHDWLSSFNGTSFKLSGTSESADPIKEVNITKEGVMVYEPKEIFKIAGDAVIDVVKGDKDVLKAFTDVLAEKEDKAITSAKWVGKHVEVLFSGDRGPTRYNPHDMHRIAGDAIIDVLKGNEDVLKTFTHILQIQAGHSGYNIESAEWKDESIAVTFSDEKAVAEEVNDTDVYYELLYPEKRSVSGSELLTFANDAVENGEIEGSGLKGGEKFKDNAEGLYDAIEQLSDAGKITLGNHGKPIDPSSSTRYQDPGEGEGPDDPEDREHPQY